MFIFSRSRFAPDCVTYLSFGNHLFHITIPPPSLLVSRWTFRHSTHLFRTVEPILFHEQPLPLDVISFSNIIISSCHFTSEQSCSLLIFQLLHSGLWDKLNNFLLRWLHGYNHVVVVVDLPLWRGPTIQLLQSSPARRLFHLTSRGTTLSGDIQRSSMLFDVYRCVQLERWSVVCGCVLHRGQRGEVWCVSLTLCRYHIRMGLLLVQSWARVRRVSLGRGSSEGDILGAC